MGSGASASEPTLSSQQAARQSGSGHARSPAHAERMADAGCYARPRVAAAARGAGGGIRLANKLDKDGQYDPDAELTRQFLVGCGVLFVLFVLLSGLIGYLWLSR